MNDFIVYGHRDTLNPGLKIFYVGSGRDGRQLDGSGRSKLWYAHVAEIHNDFDSVILSRHDTRAAARAEERQQIAMLPDLINGQRGATNDLGAYVRAKRKELRLTQGRMAQAAGVGLRFIRELEYGKATLKLAHVNKILKLFGTKLGPIPL
jgi:y4mF family transcriptional regulator